MDRDEIINLIENALINQVSKDLVDIAKQIIERPPETFEDLQSYIEKLRIPILKIEDHPNSLEEIKLSIK
ncbi:MAG: hypothetical protein OXI43_23230 [Candidatus Poribacteria bacterium]|nr:hypothetical protein [Candidatus Poribacteria bacterium]